MAHSNKAVGIFGCLKDFISDEHFFEEIYSAETEEKDEEGKSVRGRLPKNA